MWQIVQQFETGWRVERILNRGELKMLARDIAEVFSLPLPRAVWDKESNRPAEPCGPQGAAGSCTG